MEGQQPKNTGTNVSLENQIQASNVESDNLNKGDHAGSNNIGSEVKEKDEIVHLDGIHLENNKAENNEVKPIDGTNIEVKEKDKTVNLNSEHNNHKTNIVVDKVIKPACKVFLKLLALEKYKAPKNDNEILHKNDDPKAPDAENINRTPKKPLGLSKFKWLNFTKIALAIALVIILGLLIGIIIKAGITSLVGAFSATVLGITTLGAIVTMIAKYIIKLKDKTKDMLSEKSTVDRTKNLFIDKIVYKSNQETISFRANSSEMSKIQDICEKFDVNYEKKSTSSKDLNSSYLQISENPQMKLLLRAIASQKGLLIFNKNKFKLMLSDDDITTFAVDDKFAADAFKILDEYDGILKLEAPIYKELEKINFYDIYNIINKNIDSLTYESCELILKDVRNINKFLNHIINEKETAAQVDDKSSNQTKCCGGTKYINTPKVEDYNQDIKALHENFVQLQERLSSDSVKLKKTSLFDENVIIRSPNVNNINMFQSIEGTTTGSVITSLKDKKVSQSEQPSHTESYQLKKNLTTPGGHSLCA